jgi:DNA-binding NtrC family response regulator
MKAKPFDLLVVDDDEEFCSLLVQKLVLSGYNAVGAARGTEALEIASKRNFDVAIFDMHIPDMSGLELLERFKSLYTECEVLLLTGEGSIETAVKAMQLGAMNYLLKPFSLVELEAHIEKATERRSLRKENEQLRTLLARNRTSAQIIGNSPAMQEIFRLIQRAGPSERAILIQGESGTGKELVAQALHAGSARADRPLVTINCAALPETLLESELFGHEKGSFTGAVAAKQGLFEAADGGTLFIDEIGEMPAALQAKLLRILENGVLRRVGSVQERKVNVRLLAATNRNLEEEIKLGHFREDLYYRINVMSLELPPLRERFGDIPLLVEHLLGDDWHIDNEALHCVKKYSWPGNVRQLINVLDRAKILADDHIIRMKDLPKALTSEHAVTPSTIMIREANDDLGLCQRVKVLQVLEREAYNKARAARSLGISRRKLYRLLEKYGLENDSVAKSQTSAR